MKHSIEEFIDVVYRYYPRGVPWEDPSHTQTEEHRRLVDARRRAGADSDRWLGMLQRLRDQFPDRVGDSSVYLLLGTYDACYSGSLYLPEATGEYSHKIAFRVSILVPCYIAYRLRVFDDFGEIDKTKGLRATPRRLVHFYVHDTMYILPASMVKPELVEPRPEMPARRKDISFDLSPDEQPYAEWITRDIEATWGYERMPPKIGKVIVPGVATDSRALGEATLYDCLFSDDW